MSKSVSPLTQTQQALFTSRSESPANVLGIDKLFKEKVPQECQQYIPIMCGLPSRAFLYTLLPESTETEKWTKLSTIFSSIRKDILSTTLDVISTNVQQLKPLPDQDQNTFWKEVGESVFDSLVGAENPVQTSIAEIERIRLDIESKSPKSRTKKTNLW